MLRAGIIIVSVLVLPLLFLPPSQADGTTKGKLTAVSTSKISILDDDGAQKEFTVSKDAKIMLNGKKALLKELSNGDVVSVTFKSVENVETAIAIDANSPS